MRTFEKHTACKAHADILHDIVFGFDGKAIEFKTFFRRFSHEGFGFLSKALPKLGKALDRALSGKEILRVPTEFFKLSKGSRLPLFLGSVLSQVFDSEGYLLPSVNYDLIKKLRTFLYFSYKVEVDFDELEIESYCENFVNVDNESRFTPMTPHDETLCNLVRGQLSELDDYFDNMSLPAYGPGISSNCKRNEKFSQFVPPSELRSAFGRDFFHLRDEYWEYELFVLYLFCFVASFMDVDISSFCVSPFSPSRVLFVPKDSRGPRVIACEDSRRMYAQQSIMKTLYRGVENSKRFGGHVNFTDQSINQRLTADKRYATIDLKDASDLVSFDLVKGVFPPRTLQYLIASRSDTALLPNGETKVLNKFAPMGSACCFPILALVVYTISCAAIYLEHGVLPRRNNNVFVYGDDLIVKNEHAECVMNALELLGLKINRDKSFINSRFTESCGRDDLDGHDVTPIRSKRFFIKPTRTRYRGRVAYEDGGVYEHYVSLHNSLRKASLHKAAESILERVEAEFSLVPFGTEYSSYPCIIVDSDDVSHFNEEKFGSVKSRVLRVKTLDSEVRYRGVHSALRRSLQTVGGTKPVNIFKIGSRKTILQKDYVQLLPAFRSLVEPR